MEEPLRLLIADESGTILTSLLSELRAADLVSPYRVIPAPGPRCESSGAAPVWDVILCHVPCLNSGSVTLVASLRYGKGDLPLIVLCREADEAEQLGAMQAGAHDVLVSSSWRRLGLVIRREMEAARARVGIREVGREREAMARALTARAAQFDCLCDFSSIPEDASVEQILGRAVELLPMGMRYPEAALARAVFDTSQHASPGFRETPWKLTVELVLRGAVRGTLDLCYREAPPAAHEGPFQREERAFLEECARRVAKAIERATAGAREHHLNTLLQAIRGVNQLIVRGQDPARVLEQACREIVSTRGFRAAWIFLNGDAPGGQRGYESGWGEAFPPLEEQLRRGALPRCCRQAREQRRVVTTHDPFSVCHGCHLARSYQGTDFRPTDALTTALMMNDKEYGFLCVSVSPDLALEADKESLLAEVAGDIAFALYGTEIEGERRRAEENLKQEALRRRVLMDASSDAIAIISQEHRVVEANRRFAEQLGYTPEEALDLYTWDWEAAMSEQEIRAAFADLTKTHAVFETRHRRKDGTTIEVEVSACGTRVGDDPMVFTVTRDITEKKNLQARLAQSDRLASMGMLAAGVAHEINNPLAYVLYNLESLKEDVPRLADQMRRYRQVLESQLGEGKLSELLAEGADSQNALIFEDLVERFREALSGTHRIRDIARGLGTFSRVEPDQLVPVNIHYTIECAANMAHNEIKYRARLMKEFGSVSRVLASEGRLSQVFLNLLINAAHAIDEGDAAHNEIRVRTWQDDDEVCVEVRDTGKGIPARDLERVFEPFFTTKKVGVGAGLGLAISRSIISDCGGRIDVSSEVGKGTSFFIRLPVGQEVPPVLQRPKDEASELGVRGRILVIDDEAGIRAALRRILRQHELVEVSSGEEGRRILEIDPGFDLVLCDVMMPAVSGMDLHEWLVEAHPELARRVVFITGGAFTPKAREYLARVDNVRLDKPFDSARLEQQVVEWIQESRRREGRGSGGR